MLTFIKMKKEIFENIEIPEGIKIEVVENEIKVKGPEGEISRKFDPGKAKIELKENQIVIGHKSASKNEKKRIYTIAAHIKNMFKGVTTKFEYKLKICYGHFPFTLKQEGNKVIVKNFLGEKVDRVVNLPEGIEIQITKDLITIKSVDKELAGQASANFETATKIKGRDKRKFQDGVYIIEKDGKKI